MWLYYDRQTSSRVAFQLDFWGMGQVWKCESEGKRNSGRQQLEQNQKKSIEQMGQNSDKT